MVANTYRVRPRRYLAWSICAFIGLAASCDTSPTSPVTPGPTRAWSFGPARHLEGQVTAPGVGPVAGAAVTLVYSAAPAVGIIDIHGPLTIPELSGGLAGVVLRAEVLNHARQVIRALVENPQGAAIPPVVWDGRDNRGYIVPNGIYIIRGVLRSSSGRVSQVETTRMIQTTDPTFLLMRAHAVTDQDGRFEIPLELLPAGETMRLMDERGISASIVSISRVVQVHALRRSGSEILETQADVRIVHNNASTRVHLTFP